MFTPEALSDIELFKGIPTEVLKKIGDICERVSFNQGEYVFHEGDEADNLHVLASGSIALRVNLTSRPDSVTVSFINRPNQTLGWSAVVEPNIYTASAYCEEDTELIAINSAKFLSILNQFPEAGYLVMLRITHIISNRLRNSRQALLKTI